jgi:transcriptional regulator with XRE-family HTH domain
MAEHEQEAIALGRAIRQVREERGMSAAELATAAGIEQQYLEALEGGRLDPCNDVLLALADGFGFRPSALIVRLEVQDAHTASVAFGRRLRELRRMRDVSQDDLASRIGVHPTAIGRFERGAREPRLTTILRIARGLDLKPGMLLDEMIATGGKCRALASSRDDEERPQTVGGHSI